MKKVIAMFLFGLFICIVSIISTSSANADSYKYFQSMKFDDEKVDLIDNWSTTKLNSYKSRVNKTRFMGWTICYLYRREHFDFVSETLYKISNTGSSDIVQTYKYVSQTTTTIEKSTKGTIGLSGNVSGTTKKIKFGAGLDTKLEFKYDETVKTSESETDQIKITVAPNSYLEVTKEGEGYFYQGVAQNNIFWIKAHYGAFEYVIITTEHYAIHMKTIRSSK